MPCCFLCLSPWCWNIQTQHTQCWNRVCPVPALTVLSAYKCSFTSYLVGRHTCVTSGKRLGKYASPACYKSCPFHVCWGNWAIIYLSWCGSWADSTCILISPSHKCKACIYIALCFLALVKLMFAQKVFATSFFIADTVAKESHKLSNLTT